MISHNLISKKFVTIWTNPRQISRCIGTPCVVRWAGTKDTFNGISPSHYIAHSLTVIWCIYRHCHRQQLPLNLILVNSVSLIWIIIDIVVKISTATIFIFSIDVSNTLSSWSSHRERNLFTVINIIIYHHRRCRRCYHHHPQQQQHHHHHHRHRLWHFNRLHQHYQNLYYKQNQNYH